MEEVKKKRGRPRKHPVLEVTTVMVEQDLLDIAPQSVNLEQPVQPEPASDDKLNDNQESVEMEMTEPVTTQDVSEFVENWKTEVWEKVYNGQNFTSGDFKYVAYKYGVGQKVWIPVSILKNVGSVFGEIKTTQMYEPKQVTIRAFEYTNHIQYLFKESGKHIVAEQYVCLSEDSCKQLCDELNGD